MRDCDKSVGFWWAAWVFEDACWRTSLVKRRSEVSHRHYKSIYRATTHALFAAISSIASPFELPFVGPSMSFRFTPCD